jgi:hypothetical protein
MKKRGIYAPLAAAAGRGDPAGAPFCAGCHACGVTGEPGLAFWKPSTMMRSPRFRPSLTIHWVPTDYSAFSGWATAW